MKLNGRKERKRERERGGKRTKRWGPQRTDRDPQHNQRQRDQRNKKNKTKKSLKSYAMFNRIEGATSDLKMFNKLDAPG